MISKMVPTVICESHIYSLSGRKVAAFDLCCTENRAYILTSKPIAKRKVVSFLC